MPQVEPERLLKCLLPLLDKQTSSIRSDKEVDKLIALMSKFSKKLVSRCSYLNILKVTNPAILDVFMTRGGWDMMHIWINEATVSKNYALLSEIEDLLLLTPTNIQRLKENGLPKVIKNLSRDCEHEGTKILAQELVHKWIQIAKDGCSHPLQSNNNDNINTESQMPEASKNLNVSINSSFVMAGVEPNASSSTETNENITFVENDNQQLMDMNSYINGTDLNNLEFNPEVFILAVDNHLEEMSGEPSRSEPEITKDQVSQDPKGEVKKKIVERKQSFPVANGDTYSLYKSSPTAIILKVNKSPVANQGGTDAQNSTLEKKKLKKENVNKTKIESKTKGDSGENEKIKVYSNKKKVKTPDSSISASSLSSTSKGEPKKEKSGTKSESSGKRSNDEKKKREAIEARENEILKKKIIEQKRMVRKREKEKKQQELQMEQIEKDKETLQAVGLGGMVKLGKPVSTKFAKIPKRHTEFLGGLGGTEVPEKEKVSKEKVKSSSSKINNDVDVIDNTGKTEKSSDKPSERKPSSVKVPRMNSRSAALLAEMGIKTKETEKESKKPSDKVSGSISKSGKRPSIDSSSSRGGDSKKPKLTKEEEKAKEGKKVTEEKSQAKAAKPQRGLMESNLFGDVLNAQTEKPTKRKRIPSSSTEGKESKEAKTNKELVKDVVKRRESNSSLGDVKSPKLIPSPVISPEPSKPAFNFYVETLKEREPDEDEPMENEDKSETGDDTGGGFEPDAEEGKLKSVLIIHRERGRKKKNVRWREEETLKEYHYFEFDETERVNVSKLNANNTLPSRDFNEMKLKERSDERFEMQSILSHNRITTKDTNDTVHDARPWCMPFVIIFNKDKEPVRAIVDSKESLVQAAREEATLGSLYFPSFVPPDTPSEPDTHSDIRIEEKKIPSEDIPGMTKCIEFVGIPWPDPSPIDMSGGYTFAFSNKPLDAQQGFNMNAANQITENQFNLLGNNFQQFPNPVDVNPWQNPINNGFLIPNVPSSPLQPSVWNGGDNAFLGFNNVQIPNAGVGNIGPGFPGTNFGFGFPNNPAVPQNSNQMLPDFGPSGVGNFQNNNPPGFRSNRSNDRVRERDDRDKGRGYHRERERDRDSRFNNRDRDRDRDRNERFDRDQRDRNTKGRIKTVPCKFFSSGFCNKKDLCDFLHVENSSNHSSSRFNSHGSSNRGYEVKPRESSRSPPEGSRVKVESQPKRESKEKEDPGKNDTKNFDTFEQPPSSPAEPIDGIYPPGCEPTTFS